MIYVRNLIWLVKGISVTITLTKVLIVLFWGQFEYMPPNDERQVQWLQYHDIIVLKIICSSGCKINIINVFFVR